jgi:hypothetical protein
MGRAMIGNLPCLLTNTARLNTSPNMVSTLLACTLELFAPVDFVMKSILIEGSCSYAPAKWVDLGGTSSEVEHVEGDAGGSGRAYSQAF